MITFSCACGKTLKVKDEAAGKLVRCPACKQPARVPAPQAQAKPRAKAKAKPPADEGLRLAEEPTSKEPDLGFDEYVPEHGEHKVEGEAKHCPKCHMKLPAAAVICTTCGLDFRTGKTFEPPKAFYQKIPWKSVGKAVVQLALLGLIAWLGWMAYKKITSTPGGSPSSSGKEGEGETGGTREELDARARYARRPPVLRISTRTDYVAPVPPDLCKVAFADGERTAAEATTLLRSKLAAEARDIMRTTGHKVLEEGDSKPWGTSEELKLRLDLQIGWAFQRKADALLPTEPYVAACRAVILRESGAAIWRSEAAYSARRPGERPTDQDVGAVAKLAKAESPAKLDEHATKLAGDIIRGSVFNVRPTPQTLAKALAEGLDLKEDKPAGGKDDQSTAPVEHRGPPEQLLLGQLRAKFAEGMGSFKEDLAVVRGAAAQLPNVALAFARTGAEVEKDPAVKAAYRQLADELMANRKPLDVGGEFNALNEVAEGEADTLLGRMAVWALASSDYRFGYGPATIYLSKVVGRRVPDVEKGPDGSLRLDKSQMEILRALVQKQPDQACDAAIALLLRVGGNQRGELRQLINLPEPKEDALVAAIAKLRSGNTSTICHALKRDIFPGERSRPALPAMAEVFYTSKDPEVRATVLATMFPIAVVRNAYPYALLDMLDSPDVADRRAAAEGFFLLGSGMEIVLDELKAAAAKEKDSRTRSRLASAIQRTKQRQ